MSNFTFLTAEFKALAEPAIGAEKLAHIDARACCMRTRHALEQAVQWLYANDRDLRMPYDNGLNALLTNQGFEREVPQRIHQKMRLIQKFGNQAVHSNRFVHPSDATKLVRELFHVLFWLARTYTRASDPKSIEAEFDEARLPRPVDGQAEALTRAELKQAEAKFQEQINEQHAAIEQREAAIAQSAATLESREAELAKANAELATMRAELAQAKSANIAVPDSHDYNEADTRRFNIDVDLRAAGWVIGETAGTEVPVSGMPNKQGKGFADYVLWGADGKPLAVVEAKRAMKDPELGQQQAKLYADCLEQEHGQRPLIFYSNGNRTWLWDDMRAPPREVQGFYTRDALELAMRRRTLAKPLDKNITVDKTIIERYYQHRAVQSLAESFGNGRRAGLLTMATGTGKTRVAIALADALMKANWVKRVLFLADRVALVNQAVNAFKQHLPDSSPVNLVTEKNGQGRVFVSTYPTMMGLIDQIDDGERRYGIGHFDLIIIDEAHRSVYQKYGAIFKYFDSLLVGLTATPRSDVHRDTYQLFGLETGIPTDTYDYETAVDDGYLVDYRGVSVPLKFVREGIRYDDLSPEEQEHWDALEWDGDGTPPDEVRAADINKRLFNSDTVDKMLEHLMTHGLRVDAGETLGKTIIFAVNQRHANFIQERFNDKQKAHARGNFARVITHGVSYAQSLIDDFTEADKHPQIAISVDMLDTGIDVPEVLNLVFFKAVRSKVKFLQMIGRGTRLCEDLLGPGIDKSEFAIFDYCANFEFFNENPKQADSATAEPLGKRLFKRRLELIMALPGAELAGEMATGEARGDYGGLKALRHDVTEQLQTEVAAMDTDSFVVRAEREHVSRFAKRDAWDGLKDTDLADLRDHVAGLPADLPTEHISAKLFDLTCLHLQLALANRSADVIKYRDRIIEFAEALEAKDTIPAVRAELELIQEVQGEAYWKDITLPMVEQLRNRLRGLIQFIDGTASKPVYTALGDEIGEASEIRLGEHETGINTAQYRRKVEAFIRENDNHVAIAKLRHNRPLTTTDLQELERFVYESPPVEGRDQFIACYGTEQSLPEFIRSLVGMDRSAAKAAFGQFLSATKFNSQQIRFVEMIIDRLVASGTINADLLYKPPFTTLHSAGVDGLFSDSDADALVRVVRQIESGVQAA